MNYKFRKKPIVIEAFQMTKERRWDNDEWPEWLNRAWQMEWQMVGGEGSLFISKDHNPGGENLALGTLEGVHLITWNDWIIQGVQGELYPVKPDIFEQTYEAV